MSFRPPGPPGPNGAGAPSPIRRCARPSRRAPAISPTRRWPPSRAIRPRRRCAGGAVVARRGSIARVDELLVELTRNVEARGGHVTRAAGPADVGRYILDVARRLGVGRVVKAKSMATEEIALNERLEAAGLHVRETDLGEYIIQLAHESPAHILVPASHKSRQQVRALFEAEAARCAVTPPTGDTHARADRLCPATAAGGVPLRRHGHQRGQLPGRRDRDARAHHERGQRPHDDVAAPGARRRRGHRQDRGDLVGPGRPPPAAGPQRHRPAPVHVHDVHHRPPPRGRARRAGGAPPGPARQRAPRAPGDRVRGRPLVHPLWRLPQRLPRLPHDRRPGLREHVLAVRSASC